jgi:two-component system, OmpR family, response regulator
VQPGRILIIEDDPWTATPLAKLLRDEGHDVVVCSEAREGFQRACAWRPDCIICNVILPDIDGFWVARRIRTEPSLVATTPFMFLIGEGEPASRIQGLNVGADAYLARPFTTEEAVAQAVALIEMARRLRDTHASFGVEAPTSSGTALKGELEHMSLATVLMVLGMERRAGVLRVTSEDGRSAELVIVADTFATCALDGERRPPLEVLCDVLEWPRGRFSFRPLSDTGGPDPAASVSALLIEATRMQDEQRARVQGEPRAGCP